MSRHTGRRVSSRMLGTLRASLSERDDLILHSVHEFRLLTSDQIRVLHFDKHATTDSSARVTRRVLQRLSDLGLLHRLERRVGGVRAGSKGHVYALAPLGHRMMGTDRRVRLHEPGYHHLKHTLAIGQLAVDLIEASRHDDFEITALETEPACWRGFTLGYVESVLKPDLGVEIANADFELVWMVEIDRATESMSVIERKCSTHLAFAASQIGLVPRVVWVVPDIRRKQQIERVIARLNDPLVLFKVVVSGRAIRLMTDFDST